MFNVRRPKQKPIVVIRAASCAELSNYEKQKLKSIEDNAQENKIEVINLSINGNKQRLEPVDKEVDIELGKLAFKSNVTPADLSSDEMFFIKCVLEDDLLNTEN